MASCERILIVGPSGAGKSSLLRQLKGLAPADWSRLDDLDDLILQLHPQCASLEQLIEQLGWSEFRRLERLRLEAWLALESKGVLSLGAGALDLGLWQQLQESDGVRLCYLQAPAELCWQRLQAPGTEPRPLLKLGSAEWGRIFQARQQLFEKIPWVLNNAEGSSLQQLAREFWQQVLAS
jgi:shikimate kinase